MSLYIPNLILPPDDRQDLLICIQHDGTVLDPWGNLLKTKAIEVQPHGALGDLDELERMFSDIDNAPYSGFDGAEPFYSADDAAQIIRLAPTIIPADGEEEAEAALRGGADG